MKKLLLLDFSNIAYATFYAMSGFKGDEFNDDESKIRYWRIMMLNSIKKNKLKHCPTDFVIAVDSKSWRKKAFKFYKAKREELRKESEFDFKFFIENMNNFIEDLDKIFPYKVVRINGAEADDIIGVLAQSLKNDFDKIIIASNDKDFKQLVGGNIHLWSIREEKFIKVDDNQEFLITHILRGDSSDGIPNVRSDDDVFITEGVRQKPCGPKLIGKILEQGLEEWLSEQKLERNYRRNKKLIDLSQNSIPKKLWEVIEKKYDSMENKTSNYTKILNYFVKHRMKNLKSEINMFM